MSVRPGVYRYIRLKQTADRMADCWRYAADLGETHGQWSVLMWWCCGDCQDHEVPR